MRASRSSAPADPIVAAVHPDPHGYYAGLRERSLHRDDPTGLWVASSAATVTAALSHPAARVRPPREPVPEPLVGSPAGRLFERLVRTTDGQSMKASIVDALDGCAGASLHERADAWAARLGADRGRGDPASSLVDLVFALPVHVTADLLGIPAAQQERVIRCVPDFARCLAPAGAVERAAANHAAERLGSLVRACLDSAPRGSLLGRLESHARGAGVDADGVVANAIGLLCQARDATAALIASTLVTLARRPALAGRIRREPEALAAIIEEVARFEAPVQNTRRFLHQPVALEGVNVPAGECILVLLAAANRDPAVNPEPDVFDPDRGHPRLFTFGMGPHACPGRRLAVVITSAIVSRLLARGPDLRRLERQPRYRPSPNLRMPDLVWAGRDLEMRRVGPERGGAR